MKVKRIAVLFVLMAPLFFIRLTSGDAARRPARADLTALTSSELIAEYHGAPEAEMVSNKVPSDQGAAGIKEDIPPKYQARYDVWKKEFLSTDAGRMQWEAYQNNSHFSLTITVSRENPEGATTGKYKWNDQGQLVAATITLGFHLDEGYPNPIYFPVMNSLVPTDTSYRVAGDTLAATKLAHEFGHVNRTAKVDPTLYQLQSQLIPQYNKIFLSNGRNALDPHLLDLVRQMGGTPVEIWEDREYWGETNAMIYLRDRIVEDGVRCSLFNRIRHSVALYAKEYEGRFLQIAQSGSSKNICGW